MCYCDVQNGLQNLRLCYNPIDLYEIPSISLHSSLSTAETMFHASCFITKTYENLRSFQFDYRPVRCTIIFIRNRL